MIVSVSKIHLLAIAIVGVSACIPLGPDQHINLLPTPGSWEAKRVDLAKEPIGVHVQANSRSYSRPMMAIVEITVKNNSGYPISELHVEVLLFRETRQVGRANVIFESLETGDKEFVEEHTRVEKYVWDDYTYTYRIVK